MFQVDTFFYSYKWEMSKLTNRKRERRIKKNAIKKKKIGHEFADEEIIIFVVFYCLFN